MKFYYTLYVFIFLSSVSSAFVSFQGFRNVPKPFSPPSPPDYATPKYYGNQFRPFGYYNAFNDAGTEKRSIELSSRAIGGGMLKQPLLNFNVLWRKFGGQKRFDHF
uniref:Uncharacterized protein n=1 Tax=Panagrolaimus sp. ES5 TaxID=591445 RepID=A0AC34FEK2_9BILA